MTDLASLTVQGSLFHDNYASSIGQRLGANGMVFWLAKRNAEPGSGLGRDSYHREW